MAAGIGDVIQQLISKISPIIATLLPVVTDGAATVVRGLVLRGRGFFFGILTRRPLYGILRQNCEGVAFV